LAEVLTAELLLATCSSWPHGEPAHERLEAALSARGIPSRWVAWDDPSVEWAAAGLVAVRSTWDYDIRLPEFLGWAERVGPVLLHGAEVFRWNTDKAYLVELGRSGRVPVIPTVAVDDLADLRAAVDRFGDCVVKPRVGAGGRGVVIVSADREPATPVPGTMIAQPLVSSVLTEGELSVFVIDGRPVSQVRKQAAPGDFRVHEQYGGVTYPSTLTDEAATLAADAVAACAALIRADLVYARIDLMRHEGTLMVSEVEVTEPGLYLDVLPDNAEPFADAIARRL
jgi:glutathione synthase/RimK-type ligase-like ATP-grasp enzyme